MIDTNGGPTAHQRTVKNQNTGVFYCEICFSQLKKNLKKLQCDTCNMHFCKFHLRPKQGPNESPICDICFKKRILKEVTDEYSVEISSLKEEIAGNKTEKSNIDKDIKESNYKTLQLDERIKFNESQHNQKTSQLEKNINQEVQANYLVHNKIENLENAIKNTQMEQEV